MHCGWIPRIRVKIEQIYSYTLSLYIPITFIIPKTAQSARPQLLQSKWSAISLFEASKPVWRRKRTSETERREAQITQTNLDRNGAQTFRTKLLEIGGGKGVLSLRHLLTAICEKWKKKEIDSIKNYFPLMISY